MLLSTTPERGTSLLMIEGSLTVIVIALAFCCPNLGSRPFRYIEKLFSQLARKKNLAVATIGLSALLLRLAMLPLCPIPHPFTPNDFSFLLAANTFASGRLTNPTPAMWIHFESIHITMKPTYMSMYFPAQGLVLAAGKVLAGNAWYGVLFTTALMCSAICWMLQAWLPPTWALLGGMLAVLRLGLFSYWINTYSGGGSIAALGGALVLGAFPRFMKTVSARHGLLLAVGAILLATTRPYEGLLLCIPVGIVLLRWVLLGHNKPSTVLLLRHTAVPVMLLLVAGLWMAYYDYRAFGNPFIPPYAINRATYAVAPYYIWQSQRPAPAYRHSVMRDFYYENELAAAQKMNSFTGFISQTIIKFFRSILFFSGIALLPPLVMIGRVLTDRRMRFLVLSVFILMGGMISEIFLVPHYLAPFTAAFYAIGLQSMRHLRLWSTGGQPVGLGLVRAIVALCFVLTGLRLCATPLHLKLVESPASAWTDEWYGPGQFGKERADIQASLDRLPGTQLIFVRYSKPHNLMNEWVYNEPDINHAKVIWAREMNPSENLELIKYYKDRKTWLAQPDLNPVKLEPYSVSLSEAGISN